MKVQVNPESCKPGNEAALIATPEQSSLSPFDKNYTLTGLVKHIQLTLAELIQAKKATISPETVRQQSEMLKLVRIKEEVGVLKTIIVHNINQIFSNIYPSGKDYKKSDKTNHTHSPNTVKNQHPHQKEMTITDFQVQTLKEELESINNFEVNKENIVHHNNLYPQKDLWNQEPQILCDQEEDVQNERTKVEKQRMLSEITPFSLAQFQNVPKIKILEDFGYDELDLVCYEDQKLMNERKQRKIIEETKNQKGFSPILERPIEEEETMQKELKNDANITFGQNEKPIFSLTAISEAQLKRRLFSYTNRPKLPERYSRKKYSYLQKAKLK